MMRANLQIFSLPAIFFIIQAICLDKRFLSLIFFIWHLRRRNNRACRALQAAYLEENMESLHQ